MFEPIAWSLNRPRPHIRFIQAGLISHKLYSLVQVFLEWFSCNLQPEQGSNDDCYLPFVRYKLRSKYNIYILSTCCFDVSIYDVRSLDSYAVQCYHCQSNTCSLVGHDTFLRNSQQHVSYVTPEIIFASFCRSYIFTSKIIWHFMNWCPGVGV